MTTLREKRHRQCLNTIGRLTEQRELAFRRLAIISDKLKGERLRLNRLQKELGKQPMPKLTPMPEAPAWVPATRGFEGKPLPTLYQKGSEPDPIPDFLKRSPVERDKAACAEIKAQQEARKKAKSMARIDRLKAAQRGDLKRMPLTGKAALKAIREG